MAQVFPLYPACRECKSCTNHQLQYVPHTDPFRVISISPTEGINFRRNHYTAHQIVEAFSTFIPDHMDWDIKRTALEEWKSLCEGLSDDLIEEEINLTRIFQIFDDLFFLRSLRYVCQIEWVNHSNEHWYKSKGGWCFPENGIRTLIKISIVRPSTAGYQWTTGGLMSLIMHEMCHALLCLCCCCTLCSCILNEMNGEGVNYHGPAFMKLKNLVEETADRHLHTPSTWWEFFSLPDQPDFYAIEETSSKASDLHDLYRKIKQEADPVQRQKKIERREQWRCKHVDNTPEWDIHKKELDETVESIRTLFLSDMKYS